MNELLRLPEGVDEDDCCAIGSPEDPGVPVVKAAAASGDGPGPLMGFVGAAAASGGAK